MTLDELKAKALAIREEIDTILSGMKPEDFRGEGINWGDLSCVTVGIALTDDPVSWEATVEEAAPGCRGFSAHIQEQLERRGHPDVWVRTEW